MGKAMRVEAANVVPQTNVAASQLPLTDKEAAYKFSARVSGYSAAELARASVRTKSAAKGWKASSDNLRAPSLASVINMARALPCVRDWLLEEVEGPGAVEAIMRALYAIAIGNGPEAELALDMLRKWQRPNPQIKQDAVIVYLASRRAA
jgi:hypothetical protein